MKDITSGSEPGDIARNVLQFALSQVTAGTTLPNPAVSENWGSDLGTRWIRALHDGFTKVYADQERFSVFSRTYLASGPAKTWARNEYLYDIAVAEVERLKAPIHATAMVPVIKQCLWQVESEVAKDMTSVAQDLGKLVFGSAASKLLIAAVPAKGEKLAAWVAFIEKAAQYVEGNFFLALIPTYSTLAADHQTWVTGTASIKFYRRSPGKLTLEP